MLIVGDFLSVYGFGRNKESLLMQRYTQHRQTIHICYEAEPDCWI